MFVSSRSRSPSWRLFHFISMAEKTATSLTIESSSTPSIAQADVVSQNSSSNSELVDEVFSLFKGYLTSQLQEKGRPMISPQILKMRRRFAKPKLPLRRSEKKRRVTSVTLRKNFKSSSDFQLFRGKTTIYFYFVKFSGFLVGLPEHPTINLLYQVI